jgi:precorrin-6B C5,15-methyltransferase / cobalt-precorrin-6B C5,C15-methyltransferase
VSPRGPSHVTVVGIGADGWSGLAAPARAVLERAGTVLGSARQLGLLPALEDQLRHPWPRGFDVATELDRFAGRAVVVLASGDPFRSGIATSLVRLLGPDRVDVLPHLSSVTLARARLRWSAEETTVVTVVGRRHEVLLRHLAPGHRVLVLSSDPHTPAKVARLLVEHGYGASRLTVLGDLGTDHESRVEDTAATWKHDVPALNVVGVELSGPVVGSWTAGLPDDAFEHDGQLTKRDLRASALARLAPQPGQQLWDVGAGAGSVAIEWMRAHPTCVAVAFERDPGRVEQIRRNAAHLGVPGLEVVAGEAPATLRDRPAPDAVFVGGGATTPGLLHLCADRLTAGGRLVAHAVTLETESVLTAARAALGGELTRLAVEQATPIGTFTGWTPARAVVQWSWSKPLVPAESSGELA